MYAQRKHDYIPLSSELITHVRRLDGLEEPELFKLRTLLTAAARQLNPTFSFESENSLSDPRFRNFLTVTLRLHQIFALVEVDYAKAFGVS
jgi:hypothetical protein